MGCRVSMRDFAGAESQIEHKASGHWPTSLQELSEGERLVLWARRTIVYHQPCCACLGADEVCIISIVAALQNDATAAARAMAQWLMRGEGVDGFTAALEDFADCLTGSGHDLPYRTRPNNAARGTTKLSRPVAMRLH